MTTIKLAVPLQPVPLPSRLSISWATSSLEAGQKSQQIFFLLKIPWLRDFIYCFSLEEKQEQASRTLDIWAVNTHALLT